MNRKRFDLIVQDAVNAKLMALLWAAEKSPFDGGDASAERLHEIALERYKQALDEIFGEQKD